MKVSKQAHGVPGFNSPQFSNGLHDSYRVIHPLSPVVLDKGSSADRCASNHHSIVSGRHALGQGIDRLRCIRREEELAYN